MMALIPLPWRIAAVLALVAACIAFGWVRGASHVQGQWQDADNARLAANQTTLLARIATNARIAARQAAIEDEITKGKTDEITRLTARVGALGRMRVGTAICGGPASPAETTGAGGSDNADTSGRLVRDDADRDLKALILAVETDFATGRACQSFLNKNGLVPGASANSSGN